jgi:hypothetical protein
MTDAAAPDRIRTLLLRADNQLKNGGPERYASVRDALDEARGLTAEPGVDPRVAELVERRLAALDELEDSAGGG